MDLRGLMSSREAPGLSKGGRKEEMKKGYKKPGASSVTNTRSLRTLQVQNKRNMSRDKKMNKGRNIDEPREEKENNKNGGRMSRLDRLEQYRKEKLAAQEKLRKKAPLVPFRAGVYHPTNTIQPLPPVPASARVGRGRTPAKSGRKINREAAAGSNKKPVGSVKKSGTPRGSQLIQKYKNKSPKASFAPKNFQFNLNIKLGPQPAQPQEVEKEEVAAAARSPSPPAVTPARRRSRRVSGVQPDLSLTPAMLSLTPARRAKARSASRERRRSVRLTDGTWITEVKQEEKIAEVAEEENKEKVVAVEDDVVKTPGKSEESVKTPLNTTARRRRRTRHGSMQVIAETNEDQDPITPVSQLIAGISRTNVESDTKDIAAFKTPKSTRKLKLAGLQVESPLSSVSTVRGSSKRKRQSPEAVSSVAALFESLEGSPLLAKLEAKLVSDQEITEADFAEAPEPKHIKLDIDFDKIAEEEEAEKGNAVTEGEKTEHDVPYFRALLASETTRLTGLCTTWEEKLEENTARMKEEIQGEIRSVIGQAKLVMAERFAQFSGLVDNCEWRRGEKETTCQDLLGFWEMIYFQVTDVDKKFTKLEQIQNNDWKEVEPRPVQVSRPKPSQPGKKKVVKPAASSGLKAMIAAKRKAAASQSGNPEASSTTGRVSSIKEMMAKKRAEMAEKKKKEEEDHMFDGGFFQVSSPVRSPLRSPKPSSPKTPPISGEKSLKVVSGDSLRRSVLTESSRRSVSGLLLSPFISQMARRSLSNPASPSSPGLVKVTPASPTTAILVNLEDSNQPSGVSTLAVAESMSSDMKEMISLSKTPRTPSYPVRRSSRISLGTPK